MVKAKLRRGASILSYLILIAMVAGFALGLGILFATFNRIQTELANANMSIPSTFSNAISTSQSFAGVGTLIALAVAVVGLAMALVYVISGGFSRAGE